MTFDHSTKLVILENITRLLPSVVNVQCVFVVIDNMTFDLFQSTVFLCIVAMTNIHGTDTQTHANIF